MSKKPVVHKIELEVTDQQLQEYVKHMTQMLEHRGEVTIHDPLGLLKYGFEQDLVEMGLLSETHCEDENFPHQLISFREDDEEDN